MRTRPLGSHGPELTVIGLGTWAIGGPGWIRSWGPQDDDESVRTIHRAIDEGVNWVDTAPVYGLGHSEEVVGRALADRRDRVILATKCVRRFGADGPFTSGAAAGVFEDCEASLRRLQTDYIDLYQMHWPPIDEPIEEAFGAMLELKAQGKVRYLGVSNLSVDEVQRCLKLGHVDSHQPPYSLLNRQIEDDLLPFCKDNGIGVVSYGAMEQGVLSGTFDVAKLKGDDWRQRDEFTVRLPAAMQIVDALRPVAERHGVTVGKLAIQWAMSHPAVTSVIVGARSPEQASANIIDEPSPELCAEIEKALTP